MQRLTESFKESFKITREHFKLNALTSWAPDGDEKLQIKVCSTDIETGHIGDPEQEGRPGADEGGVILRTEKYHPEGFCLTGDDSFLLYNILITLKIQDIHPGILDHYVFDFVYMSDLFKESRCTYSAVCWNS